MNKKGFTVIELILSFAFVAVLTVALFSLVMNYRKKEQYAEEVTELTAYKNNITMRVQNDIEQKLLQKVEYCTSGGSRINRCVELTFQDGTKSKLQVLLEDVTDVVGESTFSYYRYYIVYDDILYPTPAPGSVEIRSDYMLENTDENDELENNLGLYRIRIGFYHKDADVNAEINIVALGNAQVKPNTPKYTAYTAGQKVGLTLNNGSAANGNNSDEKFTVLYDSDAYNKQVTLLYDCVWAVDGTTGHGICNNLNTSPATNAKLKFNASASSGNRIEGSNIQEALTTAYNTWTNLGSRDDIRLLRANEATMLTGATNAALIYDATTSATLGNSSFLYKVPDFWTDSPYLTYGTQDSVWVVYENKTLRKERVDSAHYLRPVITIDKKFVNDQTNL